MILNAIVLLAIFSTNYIPDDDVAFNVWAYTMMCTPFVAFLLQEKREKVMLCIMMLFFMCEYTAVYIYGLTPFYDVCTFATLCLVMFFVTTNDKLMKKLCTYWSLCRKKLKID